MQGLQDRTAQQFLEEGCSHTFGALDDDVDLSVGQVDGRITELKMRLLGDRGSRGLAWRIAREHDTLSLRAAEYLAITRLQADALVTVDRQLAAAAQGVLPLAPVRALFARG